MFFVLGVLFVTDSRLDIDVFTRKIDKFVNQAGQKKINFWLKEFYARQVDIYVAGFPCKAFSRLRSFSLWLEDPQARPFYGCISNIKRLRPCASWLLTLGNCSESTLPGYNLLYIVLRHASWRTFWVSELFWKRSRHILSRNCRNMTFTLSSCPRSLAESLLGMIMENNV